MWEMRAPHDVMNLSTLFGLKQQQAKVGILACFAGNPLQGAMTKHPFHAQKEEWRLLS